MIFHGFSLFGDCGVPVLLSNVSNPEHYRRKLDLLMLLSDLGPKLMATCNNSEDDVVFFFLCLSWMWPFVPLFLSLFVFVGLEGAGGPGLSVGTRHCNAKMFSPFRHLVLPASASVLVSVQYPAVFCESVGQVRTVVPLSWPVCHSAVILHHSPSKVSDTGYCKLYMLFFCLLFFFIGDFIKVIFHCSACPWNVSMLSSIRSDKSDINGFAGEERQQKNKILKYKCSLSPFLHLCISFSSSLPSTLFKCKRLPPEWMNPNGWKHRLSNQTGRTVLQRQEFQGFVKNETNTHFHAL